jgi:cytochrome c oxidase subunit 2
VLAVTGAIFVIVEGTLVVFVVKYRNRGRPRTDEGPQIRGHSRLELIWTVIPVLILAGIIAVVFYKLPGIKDVPEAGAAGPKLTIKVEGHQFYWRYVYPNGAVTVNDLRLPESQPVDLEITAPAYDVAHSWWVPAVAGKMDAIPGKTNHLQFVTPGKEGAFHGQCAEFCGVQHALMVASVQVVEPHEYARWVVAQRRTGGDLGEQTFAGACAPCHGMNGEGLIGPALEGNGTIANRAQFVQLLRNGKNAMPPVGRDWDEQQIAALVAYAKKEFASGG